MFTVVLMTNVCRVFAVAAKCEVEDEGEGYCRRVRFKARIQISLRVRGDKIGKIILTQDDDGYFLIKLPFFKLGIIYF